LAYAKGNGRIILGKSASHYDHNINRQKKYSKKSVVKFILGTDFPQAYLEEIISTIRAIFADDIPIYQAMPKVSGFATTSFLLIFSAE
jgi:hypothetical protein